MGQAWTAVDECLGLHGLPQGMLSFECSDTHTHTHTHTRAQSHQDSLVSKPPTEGEAADFSRQEHWKLLSLTVGEEQSQHHKQM